MTMINAALTPMQEIEIFGCPALFTPHRVSRDTIHMLFAYEMCAPMDGPGQSFYVAAQSPEQGFYGTVLTLLPLDLPEGFRPVHAGDYAKPDDESWYNPAAFESKYMEPEPASAERFGKALYGE